MGIKIRYFFKFACPSLGRQTCLLHKVKMKNFSFCSESNLKGCFQGVYWEKFSKVEDEKGSENPSGIKNSGLFLARHTLTL